MAWPPSRAGWPPARSYRDPGRQVGEGRLADPGDLTQFVDRPEAAMRIPVVDDPLGELAELLVAYIQPRGPPTAPPGVGSAIRSTNHKDRPLQCAAVGNSMESSVPVDGPVEFAIL